MRDEEVGIIWGARAHLPDMVSDLIRKLVEERKRWILRDWANTTWAVDDAGAESVALEDFGIPEDSWQEKS